MKVAVITPYYQEQPELILRCIRSVSNQTIDCDHFLISDGFPQDWIDQETVRHIKLDISHRDFGNTPRSVGGMLALAQDENYDAITFLDADNWYDVDHIEECLNAARIGLAPDYVKARRRFVRNDGSELNYPDESSEFFVDTNCFFLLPGSFHMIPLWGLTPRPLTMFCDRIFYTGLNAGKLNFASVDKVTVNYLCTWADIFKQLGEEVPEYAKTLDVKPLIEWIRNLDSKKHELIRRRLGFSFKASNVDGVWKFTPT